MKSRAFIYIVLAGLLWGTSGIFVHFLAPFGVTSMQMTFIRGGVSAVVIGLYIILTSIKFLRTKKKDIPFFVLAGIFIMLAGLFYYSSMQKTSVSTAVILLYMAPVYVMCYSCFFLGEKFTWIKCISIILIIIGCMLVCGNAGEMKYDLLGIVFGILSGVSYAAYSIVTKIEMQKKINPLTATFYCFFIMAILSMFVASPLKIVSIAVQSPAAMMLMIGLGVCTFALPYFLYNLGLKNLPAGTASSLSVVEPLAATCYSVLLFNEHLGITNIIGMVFIIGSVILLGYTEK